MITTHRRLSRKTTIQRITSLVDQLSVKAITDWYGRSGIRDGQINPASLHRSALDLMHLRVRRPDRQKFCQLLVAVSDYFVYLIQTKTCQTGFAVRDLLSGWLAVQRDHVTEWHTGVCSTEPHRQWGIPVRIELAEIDGNQIHPSHSRLETISIIYHDGQPEFHRTEVGRIANDWQGGTAQSVLHDSLASYGLAGRLAGWHEVEGLYRYCAMFLPGGEHELRTGDWVRLKDQAITYRGPVDCMAGKDNSLVHPAKLYRSDSLNLTSRRFIIDTVDETIEVNRPERSGPAGWKPLPVWEQLLPGQLDTEWEQNCWTPDRLLTPMRVAIDQETGIRCYLHVADLASVRSDQSDQSVIQSEAYVELVSGLINNKQYADQCRLVLLVGDPGVGKSLLARALAGLLQKPYYQVTVGQLGDTVSSMHERLRMLEERLLRLGAVAIIDDAGPLIADITDDRQAVGQEFINFLDRTSSLVILTSNLGPGRIARDIHQRADYKIRLRANERDSQLLWRSLLVEHYGDRVADRIMAQLNSRLPAGSLMLAPRVIEKAVRYVSCYLPEFLVRNVDFAVDIIRSYLDREAEYYAGEKDK